MPLSQWLHIEITCRLGDAADGNWTLRYGPLGAELTQLELPCDPKFRKLDWAGFIADAAVAAVFYVDNLKIVPRPSCAVSSRQLPSWAESKRFAFTDPAGC